MNSLGDTTTAWRPTLDELLDHGSSTAFASDTHRVSYAELAGRAEAVANALIDGGLEKGNRVALLSGSRGPDELVGLFGILLAGGSVVPLHHGAPSARLGSLLQSAGCRALVHDEASAALVREMDISNPPLRVELEDEGFVLASIGFAADVDLAPSEDLACILHTSGSTGTPKAVPMRWDGVRAFTEWMTRLTELSAKDRVLRVAELTFDLAWFDHLATARAGATLLAMSRRQLTTGRAIAEAVRALSPTIIYAVPSFFTKLCRAWPGEEPLPASLRTICFAGEVYPQNELRQLAARAPHARLFNLFGPTETNVCTFHEVERDSLEHEDEIPIGTATPYAECRLVDLENDDLVIEGEGVGELVVRGPSSLNGECRTRDRVERRGDGLFYFRGRLDRMIKLRGYRVDPSEIEATLCKHASVSAAAAFAVDHPRLGPQLTAVVAAPHGTPPRDLRTHLADRLPSYMVPLRILVRGSLPTTSNGKIDYEALLNNTAS